MDDDIREVIEEASRTAASTYQGNIGYAVKLIRNAYELSRDALPPDDPLRHSVTQNAAALSEIAKDFAQAIEFYREIVRLAQAANGSLYLGVAYDRLFELHRQREEWREAAEAGDRSIAMWRAQGEPVNDIVLTFLTNLGSVHFELGHHDEAEGLAQEVLEGQRGLHGEMSEEVAHALVNLATVRQHQGALASAESLLLHALDIRRRLFPAGDRRLLESLRALDHFHSWQEHYRKALPFSEEVAAALRRDPSADKIELAQAVNNLATLYYHLGEVARSKPLYEEALELTRSVYGPTHRHVAVCEGNLANVLRDLGDLDSAERLTRHALSIRRAVLPEQHSEIVTTFEDLRELYHRKNSAEDLERLYHEVFESVFEAYQRTGTVSPDFLGALRKIDRDHGQVAGSSRSASLADEAARRHRPTRLTFQRQARGRKLLFLSELLVRLEEFAIALPLLIEARESSAGDPPAWWRASAAILVALTSLGRHEEAVIASEAILEEVARGREARSEDLTAILRTKASAEWALGRRSAAEETIRRALESARLAFGERDPKYADVLIQVAEVERGPHPVEAQQLASRAVEIAQAANAAETAARGRLVLAELATRRGNLAESEALYESALTTLQATAPDAWRTATASGDLATLYLTSGRAERALPLFEQAMEIAAARYGEQSPQYLRMILKKAETLYACRRLAEAVDLYRQVGERATLVGDSGLAAHAYFSTGVLYLAIGADDAAEFVLAKALELLPSSSGVQDRAAVLTELGVLASRKRQYEEALARMDEAIALFQSTDEESPALRSALTEKARILARAERWQEAFDSLIQSSALLDRSILQAFAVSGEREREDLTHELYAALDAVLTLAVRLGTAAATAAALDRVLQWKAAALEWTALQALSFSRVERAELAILRDERARVRSNMATRMLAGPPDADFDELKRRYEALDVELSERAAAGIAEMRQRATADLVAQALPPDAVLVEYVRFELLDFATRSTVLQPGSYRYAAFVLSSDVEAQPRMFDLADADEIDVEVRRFRTWITAEDDPFGTPRPAPWVSDEEGPPAKAELPPLATFDEYLGAGRALRRKLLDPILATIGQRTKLYIAPHGDLARLPFAALAFDEDAFILDRYDISFLNSGRELLRTRGESAAASPPLVIADPDFDLAIGHVPAERRRAPFPRLDGTRAEGEAVAALFGARPVLAGAAVESLVHSARSPVVLHLATHGFFLNDDRPPDPGNYFESLEVIDAPGFGRFLATATRRVQAADEGPPVDRFTRIGRLANPLLRSGIALAGANTWASEGALPPEAGDGLVTAEEICSLDCRGTELVVLSACETGLGEVRGGEGVYGLRRAFTIAGARTLVISLWKVPDEQTKDLMVEFYRRVRAGEACSEALRAAQTHVRKREPHPVCWAGFVCFGERSAIRTPK